MGFPKKKGEKNDKILVDRKRSIVYNISRAVLLGA